MNNVNMENFLVSMLRSSNKVCLYKAISEAKECLKDEYEKQFNKVEWQKIQYGTKFFWSKNKNFFLAWTPKRVNNLYTSRGSVDLYERKRFDGFLQMDGYEDTELYGDVIIRYNDREIIVLCDQIEINSRDLDPIVLIHKDLIPDINHHRALRLKSSIDHVSANVQTLVLPF